VTLNGVAAANFLECGLYPMAEFPARRVEFTWLNDSNQNDQSFWVAAVCLAAAISFFWNFAKPQLNMKTILLVAGSLALFATTGCIMSHEEWRGHATNERLVECIAGPPAVEVFHPVGAAGQPATPMH